MPGTLKRLTQLTCCSPPLIKHKKHGQLASMKQSPCFERLLVHVMQCSKSTEPHRRTRDSECGLVLHACMNLFQIFPQRRPVSLLHHTSHMFVPSACPFIPPSSQSSTANGAEASLDPSTEPFKDAHQGFFFQACWQMR